MRSIFGRTSALASAVFGTCLLFASGLPAFAVPPADSNFVKVILDQNVNNSLIEPLDLEVLPDGRVVYITRLGQIKIWRPASNTSVVAGQLTLSTQFEDGLTGIVQDPNFATNHNVYMYYMALDVQAARVSRFTLNGDTVNLASETKIIEWPLLRGNGHTGGGMAFDENGNLYIATGDNNGATGYAQPASLNTSANSNDLRGKVLRITPGAGGGYSIPAGNMFAPGTAQTKPEIYAMGFRNPYRIHYDTLRRALYLGNVGPDAGGDGAEGPRGYDEFERVNAPGFYGWPMCEADNKNYAGYNCAAPVNNSAGNTGLVNLPAAKPAWIYYNGDSMAPFPQMGGGGRTAIAGPTYHYTAVNPSSTIKFPSYFDGSLVLTEFSRGWFREVRFDAGNNITEINPILATGFSWHAPIAVDFGPDGALYVIEYAGWFNGSADTKLARVEYRGVQSSVPPVVKAVSTPDSGRVPLTVAFSSAGSFDPEGGALTYAWDFDGNGTTDSTAANPSFTYTGAGTFNARLTARDSTNLTSAITVPIVAGNTRPVVSFTAPPEGGFVNMWGGSVSYGLSVTDPEDGSADCTRMIMQTALGHDSHAHPGQQITGCSGSAPLTLASGHADTENIWMILSASYTDKGASGTSALTGYKNINTQPFHKQAEYYSSASGVAVVVSSDPTGGQNDVASIDPNDWIAFTPMSFQNMTGVRYRVGSAAGGTIELRLDSPTGTLLSTVAVPANQGYLAVGGNLAGSSGTHTAYLVFKGTGTNLFRLNWIDFLGTGISTGGPTPTPVPAGCITTTNIAQLKPATASSAVQSAGSAFDGNTTTRWESVVGVDPQWIFVDLGIVQNVCRVVLTWENAAARSYQLQLSSDAANWTNVYTTTTGVGGTETLSVSGAGRYVRMYGTVRTSGWGYSLWEFAVNAGAGASGTPAPTPTGGATPTATPRAGSTATATATAARATPTPAGIPARVLVFSKTVGFRHDSIPFGITMIQNLGAANGFTVVATEDSTLFNDANLAQYGAVIWLSTTGDVLDPIQQGAFTRFIQSGRGYLGIHSATDTEYAWPWYGVLAGAYFNGHPTGGQQTFVVEDTVHSSTAGIASPWIRNEAEWYDFTPNPRTNSHVLVRYTEPANHPAPMGDHPMSWCKPYDGGRSWYTAFGHNQEAYSEPLFQQHVLGGIKWVLGTAAGNCGNPAPTPAPRTTPTPTPAGNTCAAQSASLLHPVFASSALSPAANAIDGDPSSRWESAQGVDPQWIYVDLGSTTSLCRVVLSWEAAYAASFQIQTSNDAASWTSVYTTTTGTGGVQVLNGLSGSGRYVRMYGTARGTGYGYSLWELEVYPPAGSATPTPRPSPTNSPAATPTTARSTATATATVAASATATATTSSAGALLSQGRPVVVSSTENAGSGGNLAVDGSTATRWSSMASDPQWIYVDLGSTASISRVVLSWEYAYGTSYQLQTSNDAATWTAIYSTTTGAGGTETVNITGSGRYVRLYGTARATGFGYSLWELQVYGTGGGATPTATPRATATATASTSTLLSQGHPATASSTENAGSAASNAVDGGTATRWASAFSDPQWIYVDLGASHTINRVVLNWEAAFGKSYQIQTSTNSTTWVSIYSTTTGPGGIETLNIAGTGRYVRLYGTLRATAYGYSLWEFQVFGQ